MIKKLARQKKLFQGVLNILIAHTGIPKGYHLEQGQLHNSKIYQYHQL